MTPAPASLPGCPHCGTATEDGGYCCVGCEAAAALLTEAGLDRYYAERKAFAPRPGDGPIVDLPVTALAEGACELRFAIDGLSCASCTWVAETLIARVPGVDSAHVSYGSGTAKVRFDPSKASPAALVAPIRAVGWTVRALAAPRAEDRTMLLRLGVAAFAAMNVMMISAGVYAGWVSGMDPHWQKLFAWWSVLIATPVATWSALPFYRAAIAAIRVRRAHVDIPVSLGVLVMYAHGLWAAISGGEGYLDSLGMLVTLLLAARVAEQRGRRSASEAARAIGALAPARARRIGEGTVEEVSASALRAGDLVAVAHGEEIAADGEVVEGEAQVQMSLLTGESAPRDVHPGDSVVAGATVVDGNLVVAVRAVGAESLVGRMAQRLSEALDRPVPPTLADKIAPAFTVGTLLVATVSFLGWTAARGLDEGVAVAVAVLVVACPCALALASPLSVAAAIGAAARRGILVRGPEALDALAGVDTVVFDKTGTLTGGVPEVVEASDGVLRVAAGLERQSRHPIARAIVAEAARRGIPLPSPRAVLERPGVGLTGEVDGHRYQLGRGDRGVELRDSNGVIGVIVLADRVRDDARATVTRLRALGVQVALSSGDRAEVVTRVAAAVGIDDATGDADPEAKAAAIAARVSSGRRVAFVGDGINDGPALAAASVGVAMGSGAAASVQVADAVQVGEGLGGLVAGIELARRAQAAIVASSRRSIAYNLVAVSLAAFGLVNPLVAAALMPLSSAMVVYTAHRIGRLS